MKFTEDKLKLFAAPLSETENQKYINAIGMVRDSMKMLGFTDDNKSISRLYEDTYSYSMEMRSTSGSRKVKLFIQGSYANNTNVRIRERLWQLPENCTPSGSVQNLSGLAPPGSILLVMMLANCNSRNWIRRRFHTAR